MKGIYKQKELKKLETLNSDEEKNHYLAVMLKYRQNGKYKPIENILKMYFSEQGMSSKDIDKSFTRRDDDDHRKF